MLGEVRFGVFAVIVLAFVIFSFFESQYALARPHDGDQRGDRHRNKNHVRDYRRDVRRRRHRHDYDRGGDNRKYRRDRQRNRSGRRKHRDQYDHPGGRRREDANPIASHVAHQPVLSAPSIPAVPEPAIELPRVVDPEFTSLVVQKEAPTPAPEPVVASPVVARPVVARPVVEEAPPAVDATKPAPRQPIWSLGAEEFKLAATRAASVYTFLAAKRLCLTFDNQQLDPSDLVNQLQNDQVMSSIFDFVVGNGKGTDVYRGVGGGIRMGGGGLLNGDVQLHGGGYGGPDIGGLLANRGGALGGGYGGAGLGLVGGGRAIPAFVELNIKSAPADTGRPIEIIPLRNAPALGPAAVDISTALNPPRPKKKFTEQQALQLQRNWYNVLSDPDIAALARINPISNVVSTLFGKQAKLKADEEISKSLLAWWQGNVCPQLKKFNVRCRHTSASATPGLDYTTLRERGNDQMMTMYIAHDTSGVPLRQGCVSRVGGVFLADACPRNSVFFYKNHLIATITNPDGAQSWMAAGRWSKKVQTRSGTAILSPFPSALAVGKDLPLAVCCVNPLKRFGVGIPDETYGSGWGFNSYSLQMIEGKVLDVYVPAPIFFSHEPFTGYRDFEGDLHTIVLDFLKVVNALQDKQLINLKLEKKDIHYLPTFEEVMNGAAKDKTIIGFINQESYRHEFKYLKAFVQHQAKKKGGAPPSSFLQFNFPAVYPGRLGFGLGGMTELENRAANIGMNILPKDAFNVGFDPAFARRDPRLQRDAGKVPAIVLRAIYQVYLMILHMHKDNIVHNNLLGQLRYKSSSKSLDLQSMSKLSIEDFKVLGNQLWVDSASSQKERIKYQGLMLSSDGAYPLKLVWNLFCRVIGYKLGERQVPTRTIPHKIHLFCEEFKTSMQGKETLETLKTSEKKAQATVLAHSCRIFRIALGMDADPPCELLIPSVGSTQDFTMDDML